MCSWETYAKINRPVSFVVAAMLSARLSDNYPLMSTVCLKPEQHDAAQVVIHVALPKNKLTHTHRQRDDFADTMVNRRIGARPKSFIL